MLVHTLTARNVFSQADMSMLLSATNEYVITPFRLVSPWVPSCSQKTVSCDDYNQHACTIAQLPSEQYYLCVLTTSNVDDPSTLTVSEGASSPSTA